MKKNIALILSIVLLLLCSCSAPPSPTTQIKPTETAAPTQPPVPKTLKILAIGNSYSIDAMHYLYKVAKAEGVEEIILGNLYYNGCSLQQHVSYMQESTAAYKYYKNTSDKWVTTDNFTMLEAIVDEDWDIITMQQASRASGVDYTYANYADLLMQYVNQHKTNPNAQFAWHMTWAYQNGYESTGFSEYYKNDQLTMYNSIVSTVQKVIVPKEEYVYLMPVGTAIQNARTSFFGDIFNRDGTHLSELGRVIASYTWYATFSGRKLDTVTLTEVSKTLTLTDSMKKILMESVNNAIGQPFAVTQSAFTERP